MGVGTAEVGFLPGRFDPWVSGRSNNEGFFLIVAIIEESLDDESSLLEEVGLSLVGTEIFACDDKLIA